MPVIRVRKRRASLSRLLRGPYESLAQERHAMESWAHSQTNLWHADALNRFASIGLPPIPLWSNLLFGGLCLGGIFYFRWVDPPEGNPTVVAFVLGSTIGLTRTLPALARYVQKPNARRAALWLAWLGNKEALPHLLRALRTYPLTAPQKAWATEVETALTELLDILPPEQVSEPTQEALEALVEQSYRKRTGHAADDLTLSRAYLLAAILRFLYRDRTWVEVPRLLGRVLSAPVNPERTPNRFLVREIAELYAQKFTGASAATVVPVRPSMSFRERVILLRRRS